MRSASSSVVYSGAVTRFLAGHDFADLAGVVILKLQVAPGMIPISRPLDPLVAGALRGAHRAASLRRR